MAKSAMKIRTGDEVIVISGSNKGSISKIKSIKDEWAVLDNVNLKKRHIKKKRDEAGKIQSFEAPIHISNLSHVIEKKAVRVKFEVTPEGKFIVTKKDNKRIRKV